jgi:hypothetical protein
MMKEHPKRWDVFPLGQLGQLLELGSRCQSRRRRAGGKTHGPRSHLQFAGQGQWGAAEELGDSTGLGREQGRREGNVPVGPERPSMLSTQKTEKQRARQCGSPRCMSTA